MAELFYKEDKNSDFLSACEQVRSEAGCRLSVSEIAIAAVKRPARSFYFHPQGYSKIIRSGTRHLPKSDIKREFHLEILRRYNEIKAANPEMRVHEIAKIIESHSAPRFYMSDETAIGLYYDLLKKRV